MPITGTTATKGKPVYKVPGPIQLPDKTLRVEYIELPDDYEATDDGTGATVCPDGYTFPKPSTYLELIALKVNMPTTITNQQFPLGISAIMSGDETQLLSVDSNTGRIIPRAFWETTLYTKMFKKEIAPIYSQLILDLTSPAAGQLIDPSGDSIEG